MKKANQAVGLYDYLNDSEQVRKEKLNRISYLADDIAKAVNEAETSLELSNKSGLSQFYNKKKSKPVSDRNDIHV